MGFDFQLAKVEGPLEQPVVAARDREVLQAPVEIEAPAVIGTGEGRAAGAALLLRDQHRAAMGAAVEETAHGSVAAPDEKVCRRPIRRRTNEPGSGISLSCPR